MQGCSWQVEWGSQVSTQLPQMVGCPRARGCALVVPTPPELSLQCTQVTPSPAQAVGCAQRIARAQALPWCASDDYKLQPTLCGVWSMCKLQLGDSHPFSVRPGDPGSCKGRQSLEYFQISGLFGRERSHAERFKAARRRAAWAWQQEEIWPWEPIHELQRVPYSPSKLQCCPSGSPFPPSRERLQEGMAQEGLSDRRFAALCSDREFSSVLGSCEQPLFQPPFSLLKQWMACLACYCLGGKYTSGRE